MYEFASGDFLFVKSEVLIMSRKVGKADSTPSFLDMTLATPICVAGCQHSLKEGVVCTLRRSVINQ